LKLQHLYGVLEHEVEPDFDISNVGYIDGIAVSVLRNYQQTMLAKYTPFQTYGDGNCCFRAVALSIFGTQSLHEYVRLMTAIEMIEYPEQYDVHSTNYSGSLDRTDCRVQTPPYTQLIDEVTKINTPVHLINLFAISAAFSRPLQSYIPPSVSVGLGTSAYTVKVVGRNVRSQSDARITLMWTTSSVPRIDGPFNPNHIVLLSHQPMPVVSLTSDDEDTDVNIAAGSSTPSATSTGESTRNSDSESTDEYQQRDTVESETEQQQPDNSQQQHVIAGIPLPQANGLTTVAIIEILKSKTSQHIHPRVPNGRKQNVYFVVDNTTNIERQHCGLSCIFEDDCGAWQSSSSRQITHHYRMVNGRPTRLFWVAGQKKFCREKR